MKTCWIITADKKGTIHQASGIPERLKIKYEIKIVKLSGITKVLGHISPKLLFFCKQINILSKEKKPDIIVSSGHDGLIVGATLKCRDSRLKTIHIQNPKSLLKYFNLAVIPKHDNVKPQKNIIITTIGLHHLTNEKLEIEKNKFIKQFITKQDKTAFFSIGGKTSGYNLTDEWIEIFCKKVIDLKEKNDIKIFFTTSRRTTEKQRSIIKNKLQNYCICIDDYPYNYYIGALAFCDYIFVTNESVSMISEACFTKKRIGIIQIPGFRKKIKQFNNEVINFGQVVLFLPENIDLFDNKTNSIINDDELVTSSVLRIINDK